MTNPESISSRKRSKASELIDDLNNGDQMVYCNACQFFKSNKGSAIAGDQYGCKSPNNCFPTWRDPCGHRKPPSELNAHNDCGWYKEEPH